MKVYLLSIDGRRCFFYADESESPDTEDGAGPGSRGWHGRLADRWHRLQSTWDHSGARPVRWARRVWDWMHSWAYPDESMLARLRSARRIELHHPAKRDPGEVRALWDDYLNHRWWRHILWMSANAIIAPPGLLILWVLPGPNVIGYWFAYRAIHHALIVWGIRRVRGNGVPIALRPLSALDRPIERDEEGNARHDALDGDTPRLDEHVAWTESEPPIADRAEEP